MPTKNIQLPSGEVIAFPDTMPDDQVNNEVNKYVTQKGGYSNQSPLNTFGIQIPQKPQAAIGGPTGSDLASAAPGFLRAMLPVLGSLAGPEGTLAGSFAKQALDPDTKSFGQVAGTTGEDLAFNNLIPGLIKGIGGIPKALRTAEASRVAGNAEGLGKFMQNPELETLPEQEQGGGIVRDEATGKFKNTGPNFTEGYNESIRQGQKEITNLINSGFSPSTGEIQPTKILDNLAKNPDSYANIDPIKRQGLQEFLKGVQDQKSLTPELTKDSMMKYVKHRLTFELAGLAAGAEAGHAALAGTLILGGEGIAKLIQNPEIARVAAKGFTTAASAPEASFIGKALMYTLRGTEATLAMPDGTKEKVQIDKDGNITYPQPK